MNYLRVQVTAPNLELLDSLLAAYTRTVPWESAFRIAKRARLTDTTACPRWPGEFWRDAIEHGGGGTCFESNYAFFSLLRALGYEGYLTINNRETRDRCHTSVVVNIDGKPWLADAGMPIYVALPIDSGVITGRHSPYLDYTVHPDGTNRYQVERRPHPRLNCFTLIDEPVSDADYRAATTDDYGADGLFLDQVIVNKIIDGRPWRFASREHPFHLEVFVGDERVDHPIQGDPAAAVAGHFGMDTATVRAALAAVKI
jgi:hypothetical protein